MSKSVHEMSPEEIMDRLLVAVTAGWWLEWLRGHSLMCVFAKKMISELEDLVDETLNSEGLVDLLAHLAYVGIDNPSRDEKEFKKEFVRLWNKLTPEQRKAILKNLYHDMALRGLKHFLDIVGGDLDPKDVEDYLNGKISFHDLMNTLVEKYGLNVYDSHNEEVESFLDGVFLADYVSDEELKELVRTYVLPQLARLELPI